MLTCLVGKIMAFDGENRPLSVTYLGKKTCYTYGADGTRRKKVENFTPSQACNAPTLSQPVTAYLGSVEIRKFGQGAAEELLLYPHASIRISKTKPTGVVVTGVSAGPILADRAFGADNPPLEDRPGAPHPCSAMRKARSAR